MLQPAGWNQRASSSPSLRAASSLLTSRRAVLRAGSLGMAGLTWDSLLRKQQSLRAEEALGALPGAEFGAGRAKQVIFLFMWGGPSHIDTLDPKPLAPAEVRGPFGAIETNVPGIQVSELLPNLAQRMDRCALIRSLGHDDPAHLSSVHTLLTGQLPPVNKSDAEPPSQRDTPHMGAALSKLRTARPDLPSFVLMPWYANHPAAPGGQAPGQHAGWLGRQYDPFLIGGDPSQPNWSVPALALPDGQSPDRLAHRRALLASLTRASNQAERGGLWQQADQQKQRAYDLLLSAAVRGAFDLNQETPETRQRYGNQIHGQCTLLARRLIDHGVPFVGVTWHNDGQNFWDTHGNNFHRLQHDLVPPAERALCALLDDLTASGKLHDTLVVWVGEFGRAPHINGSAGRDHHPFCYSGLLAGGGIRGGQVYGKSDAQGRYPAEQPAKPQDLAATIYHALGFSSADVLYDSLQRPHALFTGNPLASLFA